MADVTKKPRKPRRNLIAEWKELIIYCYVNIEVLEALKLEEAEPRIAVFKAILTKMGEA